MINVMNVNFMLNYSCVETPEKCESQLEQKMSFLRKLFRLTGCERLDKENKDDKQEVPENISDDMFEENDLLVSKDEVFAERLSELRYVPGAWRSPGLNRRMVDRVRDTPRLARKAMSRMTSPMVMKKKEDEIYIVTLNVVHSSGMVERGQGKSDAW